ncbi:MAG TPA: diaminopimelate decarboxylase [Thermomicrobiales bacterium]|nr:diaminopimelate decarboxylase [Thermomicrobiales bacterium]
MTWPVTTRRDASGVLTIGGVALPAMAEAYGTPLYVFDETTLRQRARSIRGAFEAAYPNSRVVYAGKALLSPTIVGILAEEEIGLDVVSGGELAAGLRAGMPAAAMTLHGNNKSADELRQAVAAGVGLIAIDNDLEIELLRDNVADGAGEVAVLLRLNPGIAAHTNEKMRTGALDSKFGFPIETGQALAAAERVAATPGLALVGYHAHIGSQIFDATLVERTIERLLAFAAAARDRCGVAPRVIVPGGGFGVADDASGADVSIAAWANAAAGAIERGAARWGLPLPELVVEPGRAIVGPAGVALYRVGARKAIPGVRTYVSIDGGMADNIRPSLYGARYSAALANRDGAGAPTETVTIAGKYCESGDLLIEQIDLPRLAAGDLLAVPMAGAYCLAMASNYNLAPRPAAALVNDGRHRLFRRRETLDDMLATELTPAAVGR